MNTPSIAAAANPYRKIAVLLLVVLITSCAFTILGLLAAQNTIRLAYESQNRSLLLSNELRQTSDDLTKMARSYVVTGDVRYHNYFKEILAIRDGTKKRPLDYSNVYWDLVLLDDKRPRDFGKPQSLLSLIEATGIAPQEYARLEVAKQASDQLATIETQVLKAVSELGPQHNQERLQLLARLNDEGYMASKARIMQPIADFRELMTQRTGAVIDAESARLHRLSLALLVEGSGICLLLIGLVNWIRQDYRQREAVIQSTIALLTQNVAKQTQSLQDSEILLQLFIAHAPVALAMFDTQMVYLTASERWSRIYGLDASTLAGQSHYAIFPDMPESWKTIHQRGLAGETFKANEDRFLRADGTEQWLRWEMLPWRYSDQRIGGLIIMLEDITVERRARIELERTQLLLEEGEKIAQLGCWEYLSESQKTIWSNGERAIFGLDVATPSPDYTAMLRTAIHPDDAAPLDRCFREAYEKALPFEMTHKIVRPSGEVRSVIERALPKFDIEGRLSSYIGITLDITESSRMERMDKTRAEILQAMIEGAALPELLLSIISHIEQVSPHTICSILLLDDSRTFFDQVFGPTLPDFYNQGIQGSRIGHGIGSCGTAAFDNCRVIVEDIQNHPYWIDFRELAAKADLASCWSEPICDSTGCVVATFAMYHRHIGQPNGDDLLLIDRAASLASIAIELNATQQRLAHKQAQLESAIQAFDAGMWEWDLNHQHVLWSESIWSLYGLNRDEVTPSHEAWRQTLDPIQRTTIESLLASAVEQKTRFELEWSVTPATGTPQRWLLSRGNPQFDATGNLIGYIGLVTDITVQKQLENQLQCLNEQLEDQVKKRTEALQLSENRFKQILKNHPIAVLLIDAQGLIREANYKAGELLRCVPESLIGNNVDELIPPHRRSGHDSLRSQFIKNPEHRQMSANREVMILAKDGTEIPVEIGLGPVILDGINFVITALNDISSRKAAELSLRESEDTLQRAQQVAKIGSWKLKQSSDTFVLSAEAGRIFDLSHNTVNLAELVALIYPIDREAFESAWQRALQNSPFDTCFRIQIQGELKWIKAIGVIHHDIGFNPMEGMGTFQDISEIKHVEIQMQEALNYLKLATTAAGVGIWSWDLKSNEFAFDATMLKLYELDGNNPTINFNQWLTLIHPEDLDTTKTAFNNALLNQIPFNRLFRIHLTNNGIRYLQPDSIFEYDEHGYPVRMVGISRDVTDTYEYQKGLNKAKLDAEFANESKSNFLANMSHEIRTPMNAIIGLSSLVLDTELTWQQRDYLDRVQSAGKALMNLINDILDYSKIEAGHVSFVKAPFRIVQAIRNSTMLFTQVLSEKRLAFHVDLAPDLPDTLIGDSMRLEQVLNNLIGNAIKFTTVGEIRLNVECLTPSTEKNNLTLLRFSVSDTGIGINPELIPYLFTPFTQADESISRRFGGTGLGLSISKSLVEYMNGEITVTSAQGQGSVFSFTAAFEHPIQERLSPSEAASLAVLAPPSLQSIQGAKILLAEDSQANQMVALGYLKKLQFNVTLARNGLDAIKCLHEQAFDLILMDIQMPVMDGYEATRHIRQLPQGQHIPIIALSASVQSDVKQTCLAFGMNDHLSKPIDIDLLQLCLLKWITPNSNSRGRHEHPKPTLASEPFIAIDHQTLQPMILELEQFLEENMLDAKRVAERIHLLLDKTSQSDSFMIVFNQVRKMRFKDALRSLRAFKQQLAEISDEDEI